MPYDRIVYARLPRTHDGRRLLHLIEAYIRRFGMYQTYGDYRLPFSFTALISPHLVISELRDMLRTKRAIPVSADREIASRQKALFRKLRSHYPNIPLRELSRIVRQGRRAFQVRDDHGIHFDSAKNGLFVSACHAVGRVLSRCGVINDWQDIFYLSSSEIEGLISGNAISPELINERKAAYRAHRCTLPLATADTNAVPTCETKASPTAVLSCQATMNARVEGYAWIAGKDPKPDQESIILIVAHERALPIMPYLSQIQALVIDNGSPYSHLAITTREYGIPAFYNTKHACSIANGQKIVLDGASGTLTMLT